MQVARIYDEDGNLMEELRPDDTERRCNDGRCGGCDGCLLMQAQYSGFQIEWWCEPCENTGVIDYADYDFPGYPEVCPHCRGRDED